MEKTINVHRIAIMTGIGHGFTHVYQVVLPPLYPLLIEEFSFSYMQLGSLATAMTLSYGLSQALMGPLSDKIGRKNLLLWGGALFALATLLTGLARDFNQLLVFQILGGIGGSVYHPVAMALVTDVTVHKGRGRAMGIQGSGGVVGNAVTPPLVIFLAIFINWRWALIMLGLLGLLFIPIFHRYLEESPASLRSGSASREGPHEGHGKESQGLLKWGFFAVLLAIWMSRSMINRGFMTFLPSYLVDVYGFSLGLSGFFLAIYWLLASLGYFVGGELADRYDRLLMLLISMATTTGGLFILVFLPFESQLLLRVNFLLLGALFFLGVPSLFSIYADNLKPHKRGTFFSLGFTLGFTGSALIPVLMGIFADRWGMALAFLPVLGISLLSLGLIGFAQGMKIKR